jgi:hypothetical protein
LLTGQSFLGLLDDGRLRRHLVAEHGALRRVAGGLDAGEIELDELGDPLRAAAVLVEKPDELLNSGVASGSKKLICASHSLTDFGPGRAAATATPRPSGCPP